MLKNEIVIVSSTDNFFDADVIKTDYSNKKPRSAYVFVLSLPRAALPE